MGHYTFKSLSAGKHTVEVQYNDSAPYQFTTPPQVETDTNVIVNFGVALRKAMLIGSVRDDAQRPLGNILLQITGPTDSTLRSSSSGTFVLGKLDAGTYKVRVDTASLPASYVLPADLQTVSIDPDQPGRIEFVAHALRSVTGIAVCHQAALDSHNLVLRFDGGASPVAVEDNGRFSIRDIASGRHQLVLDYDGRQHRTVVDVPGDPGNVHLQLDACGDNASSEAPTQ